MSNSLPLISILTSFAYGRKRAPGEFIAKIVAGRSSGEKRKGGSFGRGDPGTAGRRCLKSLWPLDSLFFKQHPTSMRLASRPSRAPQLIDRLVGRNTRT